MEQVSMFEVSDSYARLDKAGDPLVGLSERVRWYRLDKLLKPVTFAPTAKGGRPGIKPQIMVRCLLLQALYNLSDEGCEYQINDRLSFKRFVGLGVNEKAPDAKTIWLYRERVIALKLDNTLWEWFQKELLRHGYEARKGQILDATFTQTHKPTRDWDDEDDDGYDLTPRQEQQIDRDATFTKKNERSYHGYKLHTQIDNKHKLIRRQTTTTASTHDSQIQDQLVDPTGNTGRKVWADSAYRSKEHEQTLREQGLVSQIHHRAWRNKPLTPAKIRTNTTRSKVRARVEHVYGYMITSMGGLMIHTIGLARASCKNTLKCLAYNMRRFVFLENQKSRENCA